MRVARYGKAVAVRFGKALEKNLRVYAIEHDVNETDVIRSAVECYLKNPNCEAKRRINHTS